MAEENTTGVSAAFEILLEEMETEIDLANQVVSQTVERNDYDRARELITRAEELTEFRDRLVSLRREWETHIIEYTEEEEEAGAGERRNLGRLRRGLRTPDTFFYRPILSTLDQSGGAARAGDVIIAIEPIVKGQLKDVDFESTPSNPDRPRWDNTARWARWQMVKEGLLKDDSPWGVWEISDKGRRFLAEQGG